MERLKSFRSIAFTTLQMCEITWQVNPIISTSIVLLAAIQGLFPLVNAWLSKKLFDLLNRVTEGVEIQGLVKLAILILLAQTAIEVFSRIIQPLAQYLNSELGRKLTVKVQSTIYKKLNSFIGLSYFETPRFHDTVAMATQEAEIGPQQILQYITQIFRDVVILISFLTVLVSFNPLLATIVMMAVLPQLILDLHMGRQRFQISYSNSPKQRFAFYYRQLLSRIDAVKELRLFNLGEHFLGKLLRTISDIHNSQRRQEQRQIKWQLIINLIHSLVGKVGFVIVVAQAFLGNISIGDVVLYTSAVASVQIALIGLFSTFSQLSESLLFFKQYTRLISLPPDLPIPTVPHPISPLKLGIEFRDVSFRYDEQYPWVLHHFNLTIPAGKCLALVGMNGAGKTTLVKLLTRFYDPTEGQILWDGIDIREFDPKALRQQVSAIFQDFTKYDLSAQENIGVGNIQHLENLARIKEAAQKADISNIIEDLPQGYQTPLSRWLTENEIGSDLSIGQWQKVAIARMWMRDASLLILDEPTSALDVKTEFAIYSQFVDLIEGQTCLLISHRFSTMNIANIIAVIENGRIVEYGTHRELLANGDSYAKLYGYYSKLHKEDPIGQNGTPVADDYNTVMNPTKH